VSELSCLVESEKASRLDLSFYEFTNAVRRVGLMNNLPDQLWFISLSSIEALTKQFRFTTVQA